jgi:hypothetical protein
MRGEGRGHDQQGQQRLDRPAVGNQRQQEEMHCHQEDAQGQYETPRLNVGQDAIPERRTKKCPVGRQRPEDARHQQQLLDGRGHSEALAASACIAARQQ